MKALPASKRAIERILRRLGYEIRRREPDQPRRYSFLDGVLEGMMVSQDDLLTVVQIGANDGLTNDPLSRFLNTYREVTRALLIEPQPDMFRELRNTYRSHPRVTFANVAIGPAEAIVLFRIRDEYRTEYAARGQNPTGITSGDKEHVIRHLEKYLGVTNQEAESYVESVTVPCRRLMPLLAESGMHDGVDLLQVDVEGRDDQVIYACDVPAILPKAINYETKHLTPSKRESLHSFLENLGYSVVRWSRADECALRRIPGSPSSRERGFRESTSEAGGG